MRKTAVITGGAGGLGRAMAAQLQVKGWFTILVDLPGQALADLAVTDQQKPYGCDLTDGAARDAVLAQIKAEHPHIDMVIYNAGITQIGLFADGDEASHRKVFEINYFAAIETARAFIPEIRASRGVHLAISSVAGFTPLYSRTAYAASKHALEGFFASLRSEEAPFGVQTTIAAPSFIATNIGNPEAESSGIARPGSASDGVDYMSADSAARIILRSVENARAFQPVGRVAWLAMVVHRLSPRLYEHLMARKLRPK